MKVTSSAYIEYMGVLTKNKIIMQSVVKPVTNVEDEEFSQLILFFEETLGFCPNSVKTMYHRPRIAHAFIELNKAVMENKGKVSSALKRMIGYISSHTAGCRYCEAHTIRAAERYGAESEKLENIWNFKTHPAFNDAERAALEYAFACSTVPNSVNEEIAGRLKKFWSAGEIVEITGVISLFGYLNRWNDSIGTEIEPEAAESGEKHLKKQGWTKGKHGVS